MFSEENGYESGDFVQEIEDDSNEHFRHKEKKPTECPTIFRKSVLHPRKYSANSYCADLRYILGHSV